MVDEVGRLPRERARVLVLRRDDGLGRLFADLLENLVQPLLEEVRGVRALGHLAPTRGDDLVKLFEDFADSGGAPFNILAAEA